MKLVKRIIVLLLVAVSMIALTACFDLGKAVDAIPEREVQYRYRDMETGEDILFKSVPINEGDTFVEIEGPSIPGYSLLGWFSHSDQYFNGDELPSEGGIKVYASMGAEPHVMKFYADGRVVNDIQFFGNADDLISHYTEYDVRSWISARKGTELNEKYFHFLGFYLDEACTQPYVNGASFSSDTNIYIDYFFFPMSIRTDDEGNAEIYIFADQMIGDAPEVLVLPAVDDWGEAYTSIEAFYEQEMFFKEIILPDGLLSIQDGAFFRVNAEKVVIPASVEYIGGSVFAECTALKHVEIASTADFDIESVFRGCDNLEYEEYGNAYYLGKYFMELKSSDVTSVTIRPGCKELPDNAFANSAVASVTFPDTMKMIGKYAFANTQIKEIEFPDSVIFIDDGAFAGCVLLETVVFPEKTVDDYLSVGSRAFSGCTSLNSINTEELVSGLGPYVFENCTSLGEITLYDNLTTIDEGAFRGCTSLTKINLDQIMYIEDYAFSGCSSLSDFRISDFWIEEIGKYAFAGCTSIVSWGSYQFTTVSEGVFSGCTSLESIGFSGVKTIEAYAFSGCTSLKSLNLDVVHTVGKEAFKDCTGLETVRCLRSQWTVGRNSFAGCTSLEIMYVGTEENWANVDMSDCGFGGRLSYYSETEQTVDEYLGTNTLKWHSVDGKPALWVDPSTI